MGFSPLESLLTIENCRLFSRFQQSGSSSGVAAAAADPVPQPAPQITPPPAPTQLPCNCRPLTAKLTSERDSLKQDLSSTADKLRSVERELQNVKSTLLHEQRQSSSFSPAHYKQLQENCSHLEASLVDETKLKLDLFSALGEARREVGVRWVVVNGD